MKIKKQITYRCEFCNRLYVNRRFAEQHEKRCSKNPDNDRPCFSCHWLKMVKANPLNHKWDEEIEVDALYCNFYKKYLIPPKAVHRGNAYEFDDDDNEPMPKTCSVQEGSVTSDDLFQAVSELFGA